MIHSRTTRGSLLAITAAALLLGSCGRDSVVQPKTSTPSNTPSNKTVGTAGRGAPAPKATMPPSDVTSAAASERDPVSIKALESMGAYLRSLNAFQVRSVSSRDDVLQDGQLVESDGVADVLVQRPNHLRAEVAGDKQHRFYFADGTNFSIFAQRMNYYATIPAPATLRDMADMLSNKYHLELPAVDLFYWGDRKSTDEITAATDIGPSQVDGITCEHYAFRQKDIDWQVWIQQGVYPLPRKLVITTLTDEARPRYTSVLTWNLAPSFNDAAFAFLPPKDARRITMAVAPEQQTGD